MLLSLQVALWDLRLLYVLVLPFALEFQVALVVLYSLLDQGVQGSLHQEYMHIPPDHLQDKMSLHNCAYFHSIMLSKCSNPPLLVAG